MQITLNDKTYTIDKVKARMLRKAVELNEKTDFSSVSVKDLDLLVNFMVDLYERQFTQDEFYDGLPANELIQVFNDSIGGIMNTFSDKMNQFPNE